MSQNQQRFFRTTYDHDHHRATVEIGPAGGTASETLTLYFDYLALCSIIGQMQRVKNTMEWDLATWLSCHSGSSENAHHLMARDGYDKHRPALCGKKPLAYGDYDPGWDFSPLMHKPDEGLSFAPTCKTCLAVYRRRQAALLVVPPPGAAPAP